jgi:hypothetical protein
LQGAPVIISGGSSIISAGPNGVLDPGETVTVALGLRNTNVCTSSGLTGTLAATGGVTSPTGGQNYGTVCGGNPTVFRQFTFTVDPTLPCGAPVTASLTVTDEGSNYGTFVYVFPTGSVLGVVENFDTVTAPALPSGWVATRATGTAARGLRRALALRHPLRIARRTRSSRRIRPTVLDNRLDSPVFTYSSGQQLSFRHIFDLEQNTSVAGQAYDGGVLEISINGGAFQDIIAAGGSFVSGGYTHTAISTCCTNPLLPSRPLLEWRVGCLHHYGGEHAAFRCWSAGAAALAHRHGFECQPDRLEG